MTYLLIVLAVLMIVGPAFMLLPSKRQRLVAELRAKARALGVQTDITVIADPDPDPEKYRSATGKALEAQLRCVAYRVRRKRTAGQADVRWGVVRRAGSAEPSPATGWVWQETAPEGFADDFLGALRSCLEMLPSDAVMIDEGRHQISLYWQEGCTLDELASIVHGLKALTEVAVVPEQDDEEPAD